MRVFYWTAFSICVTQLLFIFGCDIYTHDWSALWQTVVMCVFVPVAFWIYRPGSRFGPRSRQEAELPE